MVLYAANIPNEIGSISSISPWMRAFWVSKGATVLTNLWNKNTDWRSVDRNNDLSIRRSASVDKRHLAGLRVEHLKASRVAESVSTPAGASAGFA